jgi:hypothetical protein
MLDWRESNLKRKPAAFNFAHGLVKLIAIVLGFAVTTLCFMAIAGDYVQSFGVQVAIGIVVALGIPAIVTRLLTPHDDPLIAIGIPTETFSLLLLGFSVTFVIAMHDTTGPLLAREGDRAARSGAPMVARVAWFLARVPPR